MRLKAWIYRLLHRKPRTWRPIVTDWNKWSKEREQRKPYPLPPPDPEYMEQMR